MLALHDRADLNDSIFEALVVGNPLDWAKAPEFKDWVFIAHVRSPNLKIYVFTVQPLFRILKIFMKIHFLQILKIRILTYLKHLPALMPAQTTMPPSIKTSTAKYAFGMATETERQRWISGRMSLAALPKQPRKLQCNLWEVRFARELP